MKFNSLMDEAIKEAQIAFEKDEVPVGAIIVDSKTGEIIAKSHNKNVSGRDSTAHAEMLALKEACESKKSHRLDDCDMYVTLEPCAMCAGAISLARIKRLYFGAQDKKSGGVHNGAKIFDSKSCHHKPEVYCGIKAAACEKLMKDFFAKKR